MTEAPKIMGIYAITNKVTGEQYIGSSKDIQKRWRQHKSDLNRGWHSSYKLLLAWEKYGADAFDFTVWQFVKRETNLRSTEQHYIDMYNPSYNAYLNTGACPQRERIKPSRNSWRRFTSFD